MEAVSITFRLLASSQLILFMLMLVLSKSPDRIKVMGALLATAISIYMIRPLVNTYLGLELTLLLEVVPALVPIFTLMYVWAMFEDFEHFPKWIWAMFALDLTLSIAGLKVFTDNLFVAIPAITLKIIIAITAIVVIWRGREHDLVEFRAKVRLWAVGTLTATVLVITLKEFLHLFGSAEPNFFSAVWMFFLALVGNLTIIKLNPEMEDLGPKPDEPVEVQELDDPVLKELVSRMESERLYSDQDLRVGTLADLLSVPEYQLRQRINQELGYRNFNQFINHYRIEEAGQRLLQDRRTPVLTIALDVGFRSISSFNTAFHARFGVSPTVYRSQELSNS